MANGQIEIQNLTSLPAPLDPDGAAIPVAQSNFTYKTTPRAIASIANATAPALLASTDSSIPNGRVLTAGANITLTDNGGGSTLVIASAAGAVALVDTGTGLTGGPITTTGTISLANTAVTPGTYGSGTTTPTFTVDQQGRLTMASNVTTAPAFANITSKPTTLGGYGITDGVSTSRTITAGTGLTGGGDLSANRTIAIATSGVTAATYGDATHAVVLAINAQGQVTGASVVAITPDWADITGTPTTLAGYGITDGVSTSRQVATSNSLTGGGDLSANRTLQLVNDAASPGTNQYYGTNSGGTKGWYALGAGSGTVTSVGLTMPAQFSVSGSPVTGAGTLAVTLATQTANQVFAGPSSGGAATPAFRALVAADLPNTAVVPGSYTAANITVDQQGRITSAANGSSTSPGGSNTQVQFNNSGAFGGSANFVWDGTQILLGNASAQGKITGKAASNSNGTDIVVTASNGNGTDRAGGNVIIQAGTNVGIGTAGQVSLTGGNAASTSDGGPISIFSGNGSNSNGGTVTIQGGATAATSKHGGDIAITGGNASGTTSTGGSITLTLGTGTSANGTLRVDNANVANGSVAVTLTSLGPTGSHTTVQEWLKVSIGGTTRYIPMW